MARTFSRTNINIWTDADWRRLPFPAQGLYRMLWDHPQLSYCGVVEWRPGRLAAMAEGLTPEVLRTVTDCLRARHFIVLDEDTEECLVRSWVRFDGLLSQPKMAVSYSNAYANVASNTLRAVMAHELHRLKDREPKLKGWGVRQVEQLLEEQPTADAKTLPTPADPFADGIVVSLTPPGLGKGLPLGVGKGLPLGVGKGLPLGVGKGLAQTLTSVCTGPTPAPTPATYSNSPQETPAQKVTAPAAAAAAEDDRFDEFWSTYPRTIAKQPARRAYAKALKKASAEEIIVGAKRYAAVVAGKELGFVAYPATWLNQERWTDGDEAAQQQQATDDARFRAEVEAQAKSPFAAWLEDPPSGLSVAEERAWDQEYRKRLRAKAEEYVRQRWDAKAVAS